MISNILSTNGNITPERKRLLDCLEKKAYDSISDLCKDANVARNVYYDAVRSEDFVKLLFDNSSAGIYVAIPQIINKIIKQAKNGSFVHQKMLLEMMKIYQGTPQVTVQNNVQVNNIQVSDEQRADYMRKWLADYDSKNNIDTSKGTWSNYAGHITTDR